MPVATFPTLDERDRTTAAFGAEWTAGPSPDEIMAQAEREAAEATMRQVRAEVAMNQGRAGVLMNQGRAEVAMNQAEAEAEAALGGTEAQRPGLFDANHRYVGELAAAPHEQRPAIAAKWAQVFRRIEAAAADAPYEQRSARQLAEAAEGRARGEAAAMPILGDEPEREYQIRRANEFPPVRSADIPAVNYPRPPIGTRILGAVAEAAEPLEPIARIPQQFGLGAADWGTFGLAGAGLHAAEAVGGEEARQVLEPQTIPEWIARGAGALAGGLVPGSAIVKLGRRFGLNEVPAVLRWALEGMGFGAAYAPAEAIEETIDYLAEGDHDIRLPDLIELTPEQQREKLRPLYDRIASRITNTIGGSAIGGAGLGLAGRYVAAPLLRKTGMPIPRPERGLFEAAPPPEGPIPAARAPRPVPGGEGRVLGRETGLPAIDRPAEIPVGPELSPVRRATVPRPAPPKPPVTAVRLKDGSVIADPEARTAAELIRRKGLDFREIVDEGVLQEGRYRVISEWLPGRSAEPSPRDLQAEYEGIVGRQPREAVRGQRSAVSRSEPPYIPEGVTPPAAAEVEAPVPELRAGARFVANGEPYTLHYASEPAEAGERVIQIRRDRDGLIFTLRGERAEALARRIEARPAEAAAPTARPAAAPAEAAPPAPSPKPPAGEAPTRLVTPAAAEAAELESPKLIEFRRQMAGEVPPVQEQAVRDALPGARVARSVSEPGALDVEMPSGRKVLVRFEPEVTPSTEGLGQYGKGELGPREAIAGKTRVGRFSIEDPATGQQADYDAVVSLATGAERFGGRNAADRQTVFHEAWHLFRGLLFSPKRIARQDEAFRAIAARMNLTGEEAQARLYARWASNPEAWRKAARPEAPTFWWTIKRAARRMLDRLRPGWKRDFEAARQGRLTGREARPGVTARMPETGLPVGRQGTPAPAPVEAAESAQFRRIRPRPAPEQFPRQFDIAEHEKAATPRQYTRALAEGAEINDSALTRVLDAWAGRSKGEVVTRQAVGEVVRRGGAIARGRTAVEGAALETIFQRTGEHSTRTQLKRAYVRVRRGEIKKALQELGRIWEEVTPSERQELVYYLERTGNPNRPGETFEQLRGRLSGRAKAAARKYEAFLEANRKDLATFGWDPEYRRNYVTHFYAPPVGKSVAEIEQKVYAKLAKLYGRRVPAAPAGEEAAAAGGQLGAQHRPFGELNPFQTRRLFMNYKRALVEAGLKPKYKDVLTIARQRQTIVNRNLSNAVIHETLQRMVTADGTAVIQPTSKAPSHWVEVTHPAFRQRRLQPALDRKTGKPIYEGNRPKMETVWEPARISPEGWWAVKMLVEPPVGKGTFFRKRIINALEVFNAVEKGIRLSLSGFHAEALMESAMFGGQFRPLKAIRSGLRAMRDPAMARELAEAGVMVEANIDAEIGHFNGFLRRLAETAESPLRPFAEAAKLIPKRGEAISKGITRAAEAWERVPMHELPGVPVRAFRQAKIHVLDRGLWGYVHGPLKASLYFRKLAGELARNAKLENPLKVMEVKRQTAKHINYAFGGINWDDFFDLAPSVQRGLRWLLLAPDWTISNAMIAFDAARGLTGKAAALWRGEWGEAWRSGDIRGRHARVYWLRALGVMFATTELANRALTGKSMFSNEPGRWTDIELRGRDEKGRKRFMTPFKQAREVSRWIENFTGELWNKLSPVLQIGIEQMAGRPGKYRAEWEYVQDEKGFWASLPKRFESLIEESMPYSVTGRQVGYTLPVRGGMTAARGRALARDVLLEETDHAKQRERLRPILRAVADNNGDPDYVLRSAMSEVRRRFYDQIARGLRDGDAERVKEYEAKARATGAVPRELWEAVADRLDEATLRDRVRLRKLIGWLPAPLAGPEAPKPAHKNADRVLQERLRPAAAPR